MVSACSWNSDSLWPSLSDSGPGGNDERAAAAAAAANEQAPAASSQPVFSAADLLNNAPAAASPPLLGNTNFVPTGPAPGMPTGTVVGQRIAQLRAELQALDGRVGNNNTRLQQLRAMTAANAQRYHGTVAAITARLQLGTTPGNPIVVNQWNAAQADLDRLSSDIGAMNALSSSVAENAGTAEFLLESARATFGLSGAIDEDHRQLEILEDEINRSLVLIQRLLSELTEDVDRQTAYVANERSRLTTLSSAISSGELYGEALSSRMAPLGSAGARRGAAPAAAGPGGGRPLVVIRFDRPDVAYERPLYNALSRALERNPNAYFDIVAVAPTGGSQSEVRRAQTQSRRNAEAVMSTVAEMGLPANRLRLSSTTSTSVASSEIHVYMR